MLYPPVADMLKNVDSRYLLVNVVAQRARVISEEAEAFQEELTDKPVTLAIREVAEGKLTADGNERKRNLRLIPGSAFLSRNRHGKAQGPENRQHNGTICLHIVKFHCIRVLGPTMTGSEYSSSS